MNRSITTVVAVALLAAASMTGAAGRAAATGTTTYYVSLGDSAAAGFQPDGNGHRGYADQLYHRVQARSEGLRLLKLGCLGETAESLISGVESFCTYPAGSQLDEATSFLEAHAGRIAFITINVGSNDLLNACLDDETGRIPAACAERTMPPVQANLAKIIDALQAAAPGVPIAGMSYWDPFLGFWVQGLDGPALARGDSRAMRIMNAALVNTYDNANVLVADVAGPASFDTANFTGSVESRWGPLPINVANACRWTWFCTGPPLGPDPHPTTVGYGIIADAFEAVLPV